MSIEIDEKSAAVMEAVHRAVYEQRWEDPAGAVKTLRKELKRAGPVEPLVHGALAELMLEEFDDVDGAQHHYGKLVELAPHIPAGHAGMARTLERQGDVPGAIAAYRKAREGIETLLGPLVSGTADEDETAGAEELVITLLELTQEQRALQPDEAIGVAPTLLAWAESSRLFDVIDDDFADSAEDDADEEGDAEDDLDDWLRYARLVTLEALQVAGIAGATATILRLEKAIPLEAEQTSWLWSLVHEAERDWSSAADAAVTALGGMPGPVMEGAFDPDHLLRAVGLLEQAERVPEGRQLLQSLLARLEREQKGLKGEELEAAQELRAMVLDMARELAPKVVQLGLGGGRK